MPRRRTLHHQVQAALILVLATFGGNQAAQALEGKGYQPAYKTYPMEHAVCLEEIQDIAAFLKQTLA